VGLLLYIIRDPVQSSQLYSFVGSSFIPVRMRVCLDIIQRFLLCSLYTSNSFLFFFSISKWREGRFDSRTGRPTERSHFCQTGPKF